VAVRLYAHVTWHTWRRLHMVRSADVPVITRSLFAAAERAHCRVVAHAVLSEHVHVPVSFTWQHVRGAVIVGGVR
jgi:hypothetical protein